MAMAVWVVERRKVMRPVIKAAAVAVAVAGLPSCEAEHRWWLLEVAVAEAVSG
jgi:hypothetical protein